jgi:hypothetical protein
MKNTTRTQDLREAFTSIITMMLGLLRAHGLRGLLMLPTFWLVSRELRRLADEFCNLFAAFQAGTLPPVAPAQPPASPRLRAARPNHARAARARPTPRRRPSQPARVAVVARAYFAPDSYALPADILVTARST